MNEYKTIHIKTKMNPAKIEPVLNILFNNYDTKDFYYKPNSKGIDLYLKAINFNEFDTDIKSLQKKYKNTKIKDVLDDIFINISNIKSYGLKGKKRLYVGYNSERKVKNRKTKEEQRQRVFNKKKYYSSADVNPLPQQYENKIICADSLEIMKNIPDNCIDLIFTSPPYNFGLEYTSNEDAQNWDQYFEKLFKIFDEGIRILKHGGRFVVNVQPLFSDYIPSHHIISKHFLDKGMLWKGEILWEKNNYNCKYTAWGSWKSPSSPYLKYTWEFVEVFAKGTLKKNGEKENADITNEEFKKWVVAKWSIAPERKMKKYDHPAMFPEELAKRVIKLFSFKKDIILDPFNGVGTATYVAKQLGRKYLGIDISKEYCDKAKKRISETLF